MGFFFSEFPSANAETDVLKAITEMQEDLILQEYNVFIGSANTIKQLKETIEKTDVSFDTEHNVFIENNFCKNKEIMMVKDKNLKKLLLTSKGILKG